MVPVHGVPPHPHHHQQWIYGDPEMDYYQQVHHHLHRQYYPAAASHHPHHHVYDRAHRRRKTERSSAGRDGDCQDAIFDQTTTSTIMGILILQRLLLKP